MTYLELRVLLERLPPESCYQTERRDAIPDDVLARAADEGGPHGRWSRSDMLLASVFDALGMLIHVQLARGGVKSKPPQPLRRPGVASQRAQSKPNPQAVAYLQRIRDEYEKREGQ